MSIIIGADLVPTTSNQEMFVQGRAEELVGEQLYGILKNADYRIFNLEVPLTDCESPIVKNGPNLIAPTKTINGIKALGVELFTLANNHIMDHGEKGLSDTINTLNNAGINYVGVGANLKEASCPYFFKVKGKKYGVYACAEHEFSIAESDKSGANPFDPLESMDHVAHMKCACDYAIVLYHGGKEQYRYPSPNLQKVCRKFVEKGADLVVCQHSHCIGCSEEYHSGTIVYGQGNFLFDLCDNEYWRSAVLLEIDDNGVVHYYPIMKRGNSVQLASQEEARRILDEFEERERVIKEPGKVDSLYCEFAASTVNRYAINLSGAESNLVYRAMRKIFGNHFVNIFAQNYLEKNRITIRNYIECEAHRELLLKGLKGSK